MSSAYTISFRSLSGPQDVSYFIRQIYKGRQQGYAEFVVSLENVSSTYPNAVVPVAGIINALRYKKISFEIIGLPEYLLQAAFECPLIVTQDHDLLAKSPFNKIWCFHDSEEVKRVVDSFLSEVSQVALCENGVIQGFEWCLNEVMDNVIQHSGVGEGYIMGQIHKASQHVAICIFDPGQGIFNSLKNTSYKPRYPIDAITLAIKEGVTRDKKIGQGNGMWGLHNIVKANSGMLSITSNGACYSLKGNSNQTVNDLPFLSHENACTIIDFQIDFDKEIPLIDALGGHKPFNLRLEAHENELGNIRFRLSEKASGTGTRQSGERIRNELINLYKESGRVIEIDFTEISVVSSSFADELIGKLVAEFGFTRFIQIFRLNNMNDFVQPIIDRSVSQRMAELYQSSN